MSEMQPTAEEWLHHEDCGCRVQRAERLSWLVSAMPNQTFWMFPGGWLAQAQFEEARYCFAYGQFVASVRERPVVPPCRGAVGFYGGLISSVGSPVS